MTDYETRKAHARSVADKYFGGTLRTPEQLIDQVRPVRARAPEPTPEPTPPAIPASANSHRDLPKWNREKKAAFDILEVHGMYIAAAQNAISVTVYGEDGRHKHFGHNRGMWLVRFGTTASWRDTVTTLVDRIPFVKMNVDRRIWTVNARSANELAVAVTAMIAEKAEEYGYETELLHGFQDVGPTLNWPMMMDEIATIARRLDIACWTDGEISQLLDRCLAEGQARDIGPDNRHGFERIVDAILTQDMHRQLPHAIAPKGQRGGR